MTDARSAAFSALSKIERNNSYSNLLLSEMNIQDCSQREKQLAHLIVKTVLERKITLDYNLSRYLTQPLKKLKPQVLTILRMGACQLLFADNIPVSAAINESVKLAKKNGCAFAAGLVNAVLRKVAANGLILPDRQEDGIKYLSVKYSFAEYLCKRLVDYYTAEATEKMMNSMLGTPKIYIRKNNLKTDSLTVAAERCDHADNCYVLKEQGHIPDMPDFRNGLFHVQDLSSQLCCRVLDPRPFETVIDVCAAPGGKSMTIAEMMNNQGTVISCDIYPHRLKLIEDTACRLGITIIETRLRDGADENALLPKADRILCDVPCSGFGVGGKKSEIKYKEEQEIAALPSLQSAILENAARFLKKGGRLVYSTCTLLPEENVRVCAAFLENHNDFSPLAVDSAIQGWRDGETLTVLPYIYDCDGFFIAAFERTV